MVKRKYAEVLVRLRTAKFKPIWRPNTSHWLKENVNRMRENLWSMFCVKYTPEQLTKFHAKGVFPFGANCSDYAWTEKVKEKFYAHPYHEKLYKTVKNMKGMSWGMWCLQCEPSDIEIGSVKEVIKKVNKQKKRKKQ